MEEIIVSGIVYSVNEDGKTASVWSCIDKDVVDAFVVDSLRIGTGEYPVTEINGYAFLYCSQLKTIKFPVGLERIGTHAFCGCSALQTMIIPQSVTSIEGGIFAECENLDSIVVEEGNPVYDSRENCNAIIETASNTLVQGCKTTTISYSIEAIGDFAFEDIDLKYIDIPDKVASIGESAFAGTNLHSVVLPEKLKHIGNAAFAFCELKSILIPFNVTSIDGNIFSNCCVAVVGGNIVCGNGNLCSIVVEKGNKFYDSRENCNAIIETVTNKLIAGCKTSVVPDSVESIGDYAFWGTGIMSLTLPESIREIGREAFESSKLTSIILPESIELIEESAFSYSELKSIVIPKSFVLDNYDTICAFEGCHSLSSIVIAEGNRRFDSRENCNAIIDTAANNLVLGCTNTTIPQSVISIGALAFHEVVSLRAITIPENVREIGDCAFEGCTNLDSVEILGENVSIGDCAFADCKRLTSFKINSMSPHNISNNIFEKNSFFQEETECTPIHNITLYVPKGSKSAYECDYYWSQFREIVEF